MNQDLRRLAVVKFFEPPGVLRLILDGLFSWLAFVLCWWFAFFTMAGWQMFTGFSAFAGRTALLGRALWEAHQAGAGPTPAPALLGLAMFFPMFAVLVWGLPRAVAWCLRPYDPEEAFKPPEPGNPRDMLVLIVFIGFLAETMLGFPLGLKLLGSSILYGAWPALAYGSILVLTMALVIVISFRLSSAKAEAKGAQD
jgi:hypothetical protein